MNWSFSALMIYEQCPMRFKLSKIDRLPEPPRPPDNPLDRGNRIHKDLELFVKGEAGLLGIEAKKIDAFVTVLDCAQKLYAKGNASVEENWWFDKNWDVCERDVVWLWSKLDLNVTDGDNATSVVVDYKSGKSAYKTIDHIQQGQLYAAATALRQEWAEKIIVEFWYVDEGHIKSMEYTREQALMFVGRFDLRARHIFEDTHYRPNPNRVTCYWCPYSPRGTGACPVGV